MTTTKIVPTTLEKKVRAKSDLYTGPSGNGHYVPNAGEIVYSDIGFEEVLAVDPDTGLSTLGPWRIPDQSMGTSLFASDISASQSSPQVLYVNTTTSPYKIALDARLYFSSATPLAGIKLIRGVNISDLDSVAVSATYNGTAYIPGMIPLVKDPASNRWTMGSGFVMEPLQTNERVTYVVYDNDSHVVAIGALVVVRTNFVIGATQSAKIIDAVELVSEYLNPNDITELLYPINMTVDSGSIYCRVHYTDGTTQMYPANGTKASLLGLQSFNNANAGSSCNVVLCYQLDNNETTFLNTTMDSGRKITKRYTLSVSTQANAYSCILHPVVDWDGTKYTLKWYLYTMDRRAPIDVTSIVQYAVNTPVFDGTIRQVPQTLTTSLNLQQADPTYQYYRHVQTTTITLMENADLDGVNLYYTVETSNAVQYGDQAICLMDDDPINAGRKVIRIHANCTQLPQWLQRMYLSLNPICLYPIERPLTPTHVRLKLGTWERVITIDSVLSPIYDVPSAALGSALTLQFIRDDDRRYELACGGMVIRPN